MENGNISASIPPRILVEFEGLLADPIEKKKRLFPIGHRKPSPDEWVLNDVVTRVINDITFRYFIHVEVITRQGEEFAATLKETLEDKNLFVRDVWAYTPRVLARDLLTMLHVAAVYTTDPGHAMLYGLRGRMVTSENVRQIGQF